MTCALGYDKNIPKHKLDKFKYFPLEDSEKCLITPYFDIAVDFIVEALETTNVTDILMPDFGALHCWGQPICVDGVGLSHQRT